jgi:eukaryotic translation initiation factor 2C
MIRIAVNRPAVNATSIVDQGLPTLGYTNPIQSPMDAFGIEITSEMATVPARILPPPRIAYGQGNAKVAGGSWNILDVKFKRSIKVGGFWVLEIADGPPPRNYNQADLFNLVKGFTNKCVKSGMTMPGGNPRWLTTPPLEPIFNDPNRIRATNMIHQTLEEAKKKGGGKPDFILVLLRNTDDYIYPNLKRIGEVTMGLQTVCMQLDKALGEPRKQDQYFSNVALKCSLSD